MSRERKVAEGLWRVGCCYGGSDRQIIWVRAGEAYAHPDGSLEFTRTVFCEGGQGPLRVLLIAPGQWDTVECWGTWMPDGGWRLWEQALWTEEPGILRGVGAAISSGQLADTGIVGEDVCADVLVNVQLTGPEARAAQQLAERERLTVPGILHRALRGYAARFNLWPLPPTDDQMLW